MSEKPEDQVDSPELSDEVASHNEAGAQSQGDESPVTESDLVESPAADDTLESDVAADVPDVEASATVDDAVEAVSDSEAAEVVKPKSKSKSSSAKVQPLEEIPEDELEEQEILDRDWYILKVQSNREKSIRDALERRMKVAGLERFFGDIIVPTEDIAEYKNGKRKVTKRKLWPGYIVVNMAINDDTWFLVRETPGIGDFTGTIGKPSPMQPHEVERIIPKASVESDEPAQIKIGIRFKPGDRVRVKDGYFQNFEGDVESIDEANGRVTVICSIFGRSTPVELEHWQIEDI